MTTPLVPPDTPDPAATTATREPGGRVAGWAVWPVRVVTLSVVVLTFLQPVTAGLFVTGDVEHLSWHSTIAALLTGLALLQVLAAVLVWRPGRGVAWPIWTSLVLFLLIEVQSGMGYGRVLAIHFPLGVLAFGLGVAILIGVWSPRLRVVRSTRRQRGAAA